MWHFSVHIESKNLKHKVGFFICDVYSIDRYNYQYYSLNKSEYVNSIIKDFSARSFAKKDTVTVFAPTNIALIKYWGKIDSELNLPLVDSISLTLDDFGTTTTLSLHEEDEIIFNHEKLSCNHAYYQNIKNYLDLFRVPGEFFRVVTVNNIPTAAGLASSASGFAALIKALDKLKGWNLPLTELSKLARLGSGSACRSFWSGLVIWEDEHARPLNADWDDLCIVTLIIEEKSKSVSSRNAMQHSIKTSPLSKIWVCEHANHMKKALKGIGDKDIKQLGEVMEANTLLMHAVMSTASPPIIYDLPETIFWKHKIWEWRKDGLPIYFTQDAGPNIKILCEKSTKEDLICLLDHGDKLKTRYLP